MNGLHLTALDASATTRACVCIEIRYKRAGYEARGFRVSFKTPEHAAAAAAAGANEKGLFCIARLQNQPDLLSSLEDRERLFHADLPGAAGADIDPCSRAETQAALLGLVAAFTQQPLLLSADAVAHRKNSLSAHQFLCPLVRHHLVLGTDALAHRDRSQLGDCPP